MKNIPKPPDVSREAVSLITFLTVFLEISVTYESTAVCGLFSPFCSRVLGTGCTLLLIVRGIFWEESPASI